MTPLELLAGIVLGLAWMLVVCFGVSIGACFVWLAVTTPRDDDGEPHAVPRRDRIVVAVAGAVIFAAGAAIAAAPFVLLGGAP